MEKFTWRIVVQLAGAAIAGALAAAGFPELADGVRAIVAALAGLLGGQ